MCSQRIIKYAKDNNISYGCALSTPECKNTYRKPSSTPKQKTECKNCKKNKEPHKMYKEPIGPKQINPFNNEDPTNDFNNGDWIANSQFKYQKNGTTIVNINTNNTTMLISNITSLINFFIIYCN